MLSDNKPELPQLICSQLNIPLIANISPKSVSLKSSFVYRQNLSDGQDETPDTFRKSSASADDFELKELSIFYFYGNIKHVSHDFSMYERTLYWAQFRPHRENMCQTSSDAPRYYKRNHIKVDDIVCNHIYYYNLIK